MTSLLENGPVEVSTLPNDWNVKLLPEVATFISGRAHERHIVPNGKYISVNSKFISSNGAVSKRTDRRFCPAYTDDVLMVMSDLPNGKALAKCYLVDKDERYTVNQRVCILRPREIDPSYLYYAINRSQYFLSFDDGVQQTHLLNPVFAACPVPVPPRVEEQRAISTALKDVDALVASLDALIVKKRDLRQGAMQQLLTGKIRLPGFSGGWDKLPLGQLLSVRHGRDQKGVEVAGGRYPILATGGEIGRTNTPIYKNPSVLIGRKGTIDVPQYFETPFWTIDTLFYTEIHHPNVAKYLYYTFQLINWRGYNEASGVPSLSAKTIEGIFIDCPPPVEQAAISQTLWEMDLDLAALEDRREKARAIRTGMMQQLLTGRIRMI